MLVRCPAGAPVERGFGSLLAAWSREERRREKLGTARAREQRTGDSGRGRHAEESRVGRTIGRLEGGWMSRLRRLLCSSAPSSSSHRALDLADYRKLGHPHTGIFHHININQPKLKLIHQRPFIFLVPNFLPSHLCKALRNKASSALKPQGFDDIAGGSRSSRGCTLRDDEVPALRHKIATLANVPVNQMQPIKISRYQRGQTFSIHTDAWRGNLQGLPPEDDDWFADRARIKLGVPGGPISGANRIVTVFVYLNSTTGGQTTWRWTDYDSEKGLGKIFYEKPGPGHGRVKKARGKQVSVTPEEGLAVVHFPSTVARVGGYTDYNAYHMAEPALEEKWILQSFIWSHALEWRRVLDSENLEPPERLSQEIL